MENQIEETVLENQIEESNLENQVEEIQSEEKVKFEDLSLTEKYEFLFKKRSGAFDVTITHKDLKYIRNVIQSKVEWKGPNEAYLVLITSLTLQNAISALDPKDTSAHLVKLPASTIESVAYFLNRVSGTGEDAAQKLFASFMMFKQAVDSIKKLDDELQTLKNKIDISFEKKEEVAK
jgi:hypothetical protein